MKIKGEFKALKSSFNWFFARPGTTKVDCQDLRATIRLFSQLFKVPVFISTLSNGSSKEKPKCNKRTGLEAAVNRKTKARHTTTSRK